MKAASDSEQIQILTFSRDKWSQMYWLEYSNAFEYLLKSQEIKNVGEILVKPAPSSKISPLKHFILQQMFIKITISVESA